MNVRLTIGLPIPTGMALQLLDMAEQFWPDATIVTVDGRIEVVTHEPPADQEQEEHVQAIGTADKRKRTRPVRARRLEAVGGTS